MLQCICPFSISREKQCCTVSPFRHHSGDRPDHKVQIHVSWKLWKYGGVVNTAINVLSLSVERQLADFRLFLFPSLPLQRRGTRCSAKSLSGDTTGLTLARTLVSLWSSSFGSVWNSQSLFLHLTSLWHPGLENMFIRYNLPEDVINKSSK